MPTLPNNPFFISVDELPYGREGVPFSADSSREYTRRYRVRVRNQFMSAWSVARAPLLPIPFAPYLDETATERDLFCLLIRRRAVQENGDDWESWIVEDNYSTKLPERGPFDAGQPGDQNNPADEPPEIEWDQEIVHQVPYVDLNGVPYLNSAGMAFTPAPVQSKAYPILHFSFNTLRFDVDMASDYAYALNEDTFLGRTKGLVQCLPIKAKLTWRGQMSHWKVHVQFRFYATTPLPADPTKGPVPKVIGIGSILGQNNMSTFQPLLLDQGLMQYSFDDVGGTYNLDSNGNPFVVPIMGKAGVAISQPVCLDGSGRKAKPARYIPSPLVPGLQVPVIDPVFIQFKQFPYKRFADLFTTVRP